MACEGLIPSDNTPYMTLRKTVSWEHPFKGLLGFGFPFTTRSIQIIWIEWEGLDFGIVFVSFLKNFHTRFPASRHLRWQKRSSKRRCAQTYNKHIQQRHADSGFYKTWGKPGGTTSTFTVHVPVPCWSTKYLRLTQCFGTAGTFSNGSESA